MASRSRSLRRRIATARSHLDSLDDVSLVARMLFWRLSLPLLKRLLPLRLLARLMSSGRPSVRGGQAKVIEFAVWLYGPRTLSAGDNCLERSLLLYRYLSGIDSETRLLVGFRLGEARVEGHAWVAVGERAIGVGSDELRDFVTTFAFDREGRLSREAANVN